MQLTEQKSLASAAHRQPPVHHQLAALQMPHVIEHATHPQDGFAEAQIIARRVAGDFGISVRMGKPGAGSFCDLATRCVVLDPIQIAEHAAFARFLPLHEGAHARISTAPADFGVPELRVQELYSKLGFGFTQNIQEDGAVNTWGVRSFPGVAPDVQWIYDRMLGAENPVLGTPETASLAQSLGRIPLFVQYGSEVLKHWHTGKFSKQIDARVADALRKTMSAMKRAMERLPEPNSTDAPDIRRKAEERWSMVTNKIWPAVQKLCEEDVELEAQRQMLNDALQQGGGSGESGPSGLSHESKTEIGKAISDEISKQAKEQADKSKGQDKKDAAGHQKGDSEEKSSDDEKDQGGGTSAAKDPGNKQGDKSQGEKPQGEKPDSASAGARDLKADPQKGSAPAEIEQRLWEEAHRNGTYPIPVEKLSDEVRNEIEKAFARLSPLEQEEYRERARKALQDLEEKLNEMLRSGFNPETSPLAGELRPQGRQGSPRGASAAQVEEQLRQARMASLDSWDQALMVVGPLVDEAFFRLQRILLPQENPDWQTGHSSGMRPNLSAAMQSKVDPTLKLKLWERKDVPEERAVAVQILVDGSGSMMHEGKSYQTFLACVFATELFDRLGVRLSVHSFSTGLSEAKSFSQTLQTTGVRERISALRAPDGGATNDWAAVANTYPPLVAQHADYRFLIVLTDAQSGNPEKLRQVVDAIRADGRVVVIHLGLGPGTRDLQRIYPISFGDLPVSTGDILGQTFASVFADLIEQAVRDPASLASNR